MKVCLFNTAKVWGGGEKWHLDMGLCLRDSGHSVTIVSNKDSELICRAQKNGLPTREFKLSNLSFLNPAVFFRIRSFFKREGFDVIVFNFSTDLKNAANAARSAKIPKIVYRRGSAIPIKNTGLNRFLFGKCLTDVLANSEATKQTILQNNPKLFPAEKIRVIYNGIDLSTVPNEERLPNPVPVIGNLGRTVYQKGQDILLDIAAFLKQRNVACKFVIGGDGSLLEKLKQQAADLGLTDRVEFTGFVQNPYEFMQGIDIFALSSRWEGFGYVLAEAMAVKKPIVAFDTSSNPELVVNNETGYLVPFGNKEAFASALEKLLADPNQQAVFGNNGFKRVKEKFDFEKNQKETIRFLEQKND